MSVQTSSPVLSRTVAEMHELVGASVGISNWLLVDQSRINGFADVTEDQQFIHVDPEAAASGPFGDTIAHGFLSLSLLSRMAETGLPKIDGVTTSLNYGFDRIRFLNPVPSGSRIRARFTLDKVTPRGGGQTLFHYTVEVEIEGSHRPALAADWLVLTISQEKEDSE
ncbi:hypothetical protein BB934_36820 (plasmid) [Microvirga ossetica]|uniref:MaoC-like domain-containing protein n=2 Tax=Microvirga ossetica TaxID=1882682 RepID=A0A1B2EV67_9HYPH|nr:hypothetical protein BB934_36820 [Microvirga ossetica]